MTLSAPFAWFAFGGCKSCTPFMPLCQDCLANGNSDLDGMGCLSVQAHALFTRQAGGDLPCPALDFHGGFNKFFGAAYGLHERTVEQAYGAPFGTFSTLLFPLGCSLCSYAMLSRRARCAFPCQ